MSRYIDAEKVMEEINRIGGHNLCEWDTIGVKALIGRQPTADVVEVVRCKDCKFATEYCHGDFECRCPYTPWASDEYAIPCNADDYCGYGERREEK